jgi:hypothetical protein
MNARALLDWVQSDAEFWTLLPSGDANDVALDRRDSEPNEGAWLREGRAVQQLLEQSPLSSDDQQLLEALAEAAFRRTFTASGQHHDLAAQVSDDLRLLAEAALVGYRSATLDALWAAYSSGKFPADVA